jgi:AhpD family alkylhydroperoxidase
MNTSDYMSLMTEAEGCDDEVRAEIRRRLERIVEVFGEVPLVSRTLADCPGIFIPFSDLSKRLLLEPEHLSAKEMEIAAVAAGVALGSEHCLNIHIPQALRSGATLEELVEVIMVASFMSMTKGQSIAFRKLAEHR